MENNVNIDLNPKDTVEALENAMDSKHTEISQLGKATANVATTLIETIETCLLPLVVINKARKAAVGYFQNQFKYDLQNKVGHIKPENLIEPKNYIAEPAMINLANVLDEPKLKEMYLNLLANSMDRNLENTVHPSFVEIIKQLTPEEARLLNYILNLSDSLPIIAIHARQEKNDIGYNEVYTHLLNLFETEDSQNIYYQNPNLPKYVENWIRLGLITVSYEIYLADDNLYENFKSRPEYSNLIMQNPSLHLDIQKGLLQQTHFGKDFIKTVTE